MKILYVILTCPKYAETRQQWQKATWLQGQEYIYLSDAPESEGYKEAPLKYVRWLRSVTLKHDWYFFCDDDTFVFPKKLRFAISNIAQYIMQGFKGGSFDIYNLKNIEWCSGGAGILMNKALVERIQFHLRHNNPIVTDETDISLAIWARMSCNVRVIDDKRFSPFNPRETTHTTDPITYHYCERHDFFTLKERL